jgi:hypothetical protein
MKSGKDPIELCEEAAFLLRNSRAPVWGCYLIGTMPFLLGLLYFWSDMTRGTPTSEKLIVEALELAASFIWMKAWQAIFCARLRDALTGRSEFEISGRTVGRIVVEQTRWQPWGLLVLPITMVLTIPFGWTYAYFQNLTALGGDGSPSLHSNAVTQAKLWPMQNHYLLLIVFGIFLVIFIDVLILLILIPQVLITLFGVKEIFHPNLWLALNTTFLALVFVLTHLLVDPFIKAIYVLRCFYGQSQSTGEDLRVRLDQLRAARRAELPRIAAAILFVSLNLHCFGAAAPQPGATPEKLDTQIENVLRKPEYNWKLPREIAPDENRGPIAAFFDNLARLIGRAIKAFFTWVGDLIEWLRKLFQRRESSSPGSSFSFGDPQILLYIGLAAVVAFLLILLWRNRSSFRTAKQTIIAQAAPAPVDLRDEQVGADALPEDEWLKLANQLLEQGDLRLAIRALFLATLADLARREIVSLAKFKSNRDYERELKRRSAAVPDRAKFFSGLVAAYERIWYGWYEPSNELFAECESTVRFLRSC